MNSRIDLTALSLVVVTSLLIGLSSAVIIDNCAKHKDCSLQIDNIHLKCAVGHKAECNEAKTVIRQTEGLSYNTSLVPYLSAIEIYESSGMSESLRFQFSLPQTDVGENGQVFGVLAEFSEHESRNYNPWYSHTEPICRYFDFLDSSVSRDEIARHKMKISYDCIGIGLIPSIFLLTLQTVPASLPLVYVISWMEYDDYYADPDLPLSDSVWSHRLIAVANIAPPTAATGSLHVMFQPARDQIKYYEVTLIREPKKVEVQSRFLEAAKLPEKILFKNVKPGNYSVKVEVSDHICEIDPSRCDPLLSHHILVMSPETKDLVSSEDNTDRMTGNANLMTSNTNVLTTVAAVSSLVVAACVFATVLMCAIRRREETLCCSQCFKKPRKNKQTTQVMINLISLADRHLEGRMSKYFEEFLTEALGADVNLSLPYLPKSGDNAEVYMSNVPQTGTNAEDCTTPTGSDDPLLHRPIWMLHGNSKRNPDNNIIYTVILDFFYGIHEVKRYGQCDTLSVQQGKDNPTKNWSRLSSHLRHAIDHSSLETVLCVTFTHQDTQDCVPSAWSSRHDHYDGMSSYADGSKSCTVYSDISVSLMPRSVKDTDSVKNHFNPESCKTTIFGVSQYFLPADTHKLYSKLASRADLSCSDQDILYSEHSNSLIKALEVYKRAKEQRFHSEPFDDSLTHRDSGSIVTVNNFSECNEES